MNEMIMCSVVNDVNFMICSIQIPQATSIRRNVFTVESFLQYFKNKNLVIWVILSIIVLKTLQRHDKLVIILNLLYTIIIIIIISYHLSYHKQDEEKKNYNRKTYYSSHIHNIFCFLLSLFDYFLFHNLNCIGLLEKCLKLYPKLCSRD